VILRLGGKLEAKSFIVFMVFILSSCQFPTIWMAISENVKVRIKSEHVIKEITYLVK